MKILVTGATGFIGSRLVRHLAVGNTVFGTARTKSKTFEEKNVSWIMQNLSKELKYSKFPKESDIIIHLAQSKHFREFPEKAPDIFSVNVGSTAQLLDYGRKVGIKSFVFASSGGVYRCKGGPLLESDSLEPPTFYLKSKYLSECLVNSYSDFFSTIILRYFFVYGEGQKDRLIPNLINSVKEGKPIIIYNKEGIRINPIYIEDAVRVTAKAASLKGNEIINVASNEIVSILELSEMIGELLGKTPVYKYKKDPKAMDLIADIQKMKSKLGIDPKVTLKEGIKRMIEGAK